MKILCRAIVFMPGAAIQVMLIAVDPVLMKRAAEKLMLRVYHLYHMLGRSFNFSALMTEGTRA
jgi:hypothetical protein